MLIYPVCSHGSDPRFQWLEKIHFHSEPAYDLIAEINNNKDSQPGQKITKDLDPSRIPINHYPLIEYSTLWASVFSSVKTGFLQTHLP